MTIDDIVKRLDKEPNGCWVWQGARDKDGYGKVYHNKRTNQRVHRVVYAELVEEIPEGMIIMHTCDNPPCANPDHLKAGTHKDNMQDALRKGRKYTMNNHTNAKLTPYQVQCMRALYTTGISMHRLSLIFNISRRQVHNIITGKSWEELKPLRPTVKWVVESGDSGAEIVADESDTIGIEAGE